MKKILLFLRDVIELYIPIISFTFLFIAYILQVFFRYVVNRPLTWTQDIIVVGFCWTVILGACYTMRRKGQVSFTMLYDQYPPKVAAWARLAGNVLIIVTFAVLVIPSVNYAIFVSFQKTAALRINYFWIFIPFTYFLLSIIGYTIEPVIEDWKIITGKLDDSAERKMDQLMKEVKA